MNTFKLILAIVAFVAFFWWFVYVIYGALQGTWLTGISAVQLTQGAAVQIQQGETVSFRVAHAVHTLTIENVSTRTVEILLQSTPLKVKLSIGEAKKYDFDADGTYDLSVKLVDIKNATPIFALKSIASLAPQKTQPGNGAPAPSSSGSPTIVEAIDTTSFATNCTESWSCASWSACSDGEKTRVCQDTRACASDPPVVPRPAETESCAVAVASDSTPEPSETVDTSVSEPPSLTPEPVPEPAPVEQPAPEPEPVTLPPYTLNGFAVSCKTSRGAGLVCSPDDVCSGSTYIPGKEIYEDSENGTCCSIPSTKVVTCAEGYVSVAGPAEIIASGNSYRLIVHHFSHAYKSILTDTAWKVSNVPSEVYIDGDLVLSPFLRGVIPGQTTLTSTFRSNQDYDLYFTLSENATDKNLRLVLDQNQIVKQINHDSNIFEGIISAPSV